MHYDGKRPAPTKMEQLIMTNRINHVKCLTITHTKSQNGIVRIVVGHAYYKYYC